MKSRNGFTWVELLVIVTVISVVAFVMLPKFRLMLYQSREGRTKGSLGELRGALAIYYSDNFGLYPSDDGTPETRVSSVLVPRYIKKMPYVDLTHHHPKKLNTVQDRFDDRGDWTYSTLRGYIAVNSFRKDTEGQPISSW